MKDENLKPDLEKNEQHQHVEQKLPFQKNKVFLIIGIIVLIVFLSAGSYFLGAKGLKISLTTKEEPTKNKTTEKITPTIETPQTPLFSGQLKRLNQNLKIFKSTESDKLNGVENDFVYYEAGKFSKGELKDYSRVIAVRPPEGPGQTLVFVLATKDYQTYILDDPDNKTVNYTGDDWQNPYNFLDKSKITSTKVFDSEQPKEISLNQKFALYQEEFPTENIQTNKSDKNGNKIYENVLITNFSSYDNLASSFKNLTFYSKPYSGNTAYFNELTQAEKDKELMKQKYLLGDTEVIVVDSVGLPMAYSLTTPENIKNYNEKQAQYEIDMKKYKEELKKYEDKKITEYPKYPDYVFLPNLGFISSKIDNKNNLQFYHDYEIAIPAACSTKYNTHIVRVNDSELEEIGSVFDNLLLYRLKDKNHPLYTLAYKNKMDYYDQDPKMFDMVNKGIKKPTLEEYVANNPLLIFKDYWQRFVAVGEYDIKLPGGCGKPVIYLYPEKPTEVSIKFQTPISLTTEIPKYADFWRVMAYPGSLLVNLKQELTDCQKIDFEKKGSEYAKEACQKNSYPYLYWTGNVNSRNYPEINEGWIVKKNDLNNFLEEKLTGVGLNGKEKNDFMSYWLTEMLSKNAPYYRISFLQTSDLNSLFPMTVNPTPDTTFRLFLDYLPLVEKPQNLPVPQILNKLVRKGFTLVEWGGLKRP